MGRDANGFSLSEGYKEVLVSPRVALHEETINEDGYSEFNSIIKETAPILIPTEVLKSPTQHPMINCSSPHEAQKSHPFDSLSQY